ncbi:MAG: hypothetical protein J7J91_08750 [Deltaproteobacteria bacterium]|nr:hypothetical protein [Deltaproteobacteria bacterium]
MAKMEYKAEYERKRMLENLGYKVYRVSGIPGNLLALRKEGRRYMVYVEIVKSVKGDVFYFDKKTRDDWRKLRRAGIDSYLVLRFSYKHRVSWRTMRILTDPPKKISLHGD